MDLPTEPGTIVGTWPGMDVIVSVSSRADHGALAVLSLTTTGAFPQSYAAVFERAALVAYLREFAVDSLAPGPWWGSRRKAAQRKLLALNHGKSVGLLWGVAGAGAPSMRDRAWLLIEVGPPGCTTHLTMDVTFQDGAFALHDTGCFTPSKISALLAAAAA